MTKSIFTDQYDRLCALLIKARIDAGLSQTELAKCLKRPQSFVSKYETKQRRLDVVEFLEITHCMKVNGADLVRQLTDADDQPGTPRPSAKNQPTAIKNGATRAAKLNGNGAAPR